MSSSKIPENPELFRSITNSAKESSLAQTPSTSPTSSESTRRLKIQSSRPQIADVRASMRAISCRHVGVLLYCAPAGATPSRRSQIVENFITTSTSYRISDLMLEIEASLDYIAAYFSGCDSWRSCVGDRKTSHRRSRSSG